MNAINAKYVIVWMYDVHAEYQMQFAEAYATNGAWTQLFRRSADYVGTQLGHDESHPQRYIIVDYWTSSEVYHSFLKEYKTEYQDLDAQCDGWTLNETLVGKFHC